MTLLFTLCLFGASLYGMRLIPQQFFPSSDRPELLVDLQLPENVSIYETQDVSARVDKLLKDDQDVDHFLEQANCRHHFRRNNLWPIHSLVGAAACRSLTMTSSRESSRPCGSHRPSVLSEPVTKTPSGLL